jgi:hypothetical protein
LGLIGVADGDMAWGRIEPPTSRISVRTATVALADATTARSGTERADGSLQPFAHDRLAYVIAFTGVPCMPVGPPGRPPPAVPYICTFVSLIDAQTGVVIFSLSGPDLQDRDR